MTDARDDHLPRAFARVIAAPISRRADVLDELCGDDEEMRRQLLRLVAAADEVTRGAHPLGDTAIEARERALIEPSAERPRLPGDSTIAGYTIERLLGEGGMGSVYLATQERPARQVALKLVKSGFSSERALRRFELEAETLGRLRHPGIAQIHEAGLHEGRPFFAMEYVDGLTLTEYADAKKLGTRERLRLIAKVAAAVQHAHQQGVIHRDLKPGNIMVTEVETDTGRVAQPKVLDFGVAKVTESDIRATTMQTDIGQLVGTIPYMSPEQAGGDPSSLDTRSDVYALGVVAFELLTGRLPHNLKDRLVHEAVRMIREDEPSRLSAIDKTLRGDVETIIAKALEKEPDRRYASASDLASDIGRYLDDQPIQARPASTWYQLRKFSRRNRALVGGVAATFLVLVAGVIGTTIFAVRADAARADANRSAEQAKLALAAETKAQQETAEALAAEQERTEQLEALVGYQQGQLSGIDAMSMGLGIRDGVLEKARAVAERVGMGEAAIEARLADMDDALAGADFTGLALDTLRLNIFEPAIEVAQRDFEDQPLVLARLLHTISETAMAVGLHDLAEAPQARVIEILRRELGDEHTETLLSVNNMGSLLDSLGRLDEAEVFLREALVGYRRVFGAGDVNTLRVMNNLGKLLVAQGRLDEAEPLLREAAGGIARALGEDHFETLRVHANLAILLKEQGKRDESGAIGRDLLERRRRTLGNDHIATLGSINDVANALRHEGALDEAEAHYREAVAGFRRSLGDDHRETLVTLGNLGFLLSERGKHDEALLYHQEGLEGFRRVFGSDHPDTLSMMDRTGALLNSLDEPDEAESLLKEALERRRRVLGDDHAHTMVSLNGVGMFLKGQGKLAEAEAYFQEALDGFHRLVGPDHPNTLITTHNLGDIARQLGDFERAEVWYTESVAGVRRVLPEQHTFRLVTTWRLGQARVHLGELGDAEALLIEAHAGLHSAFGPSDNRTIGVTRTLEELYTRWHEAEPDAGHDLTAAEWRSKLPVKEGGGTD